ATRPAGRAAGAAARRVAWLRELVPDGSLTRPGAVRGGRNDGGRLADRCSPSDRVLDAGWVQSSKTSNPGINCWVRREQVPIAVAAGAEWAGKPQVLAAAV